MKQILQHLKTGQMELAEVPCPQVGRGQVLIQTKASLISAGTERMLIEFSKANLIQKARQQPDRVKQVLDKIKTDGVMPTLEAVFRKLDEPLPLGYCNAGVVLEVGPSVADLQVGDRVISNGNHAEIVCVPRNLVAKVPENVTDEQAAFTVLSSIALQGVRLAQPTLGERIMVFGAGLIGLVTIQLLRSCGCDVLAVDLNEERLALAARFGARTVNLARGANPIAAAQGWTSEQGVDAAIITASAKTNEIIHQAAESCRKRGRIVLVGVVGLNLSRRDFYKKELTFQVSCSYGPGRYDEYYEQEGHDYPLGYVRWTESRNFEAVLAAMSNGGLNVDPLITHRYRLADALNAYETIKNDSSALGVILQYAEPVDRSPTLRMAQASVVPSHDCVVGIIGAGNFAVSTILPCLKKTSARLKYIAGRTRVTAVQHAATKFGVEYATTDYRQILEDEEVNAVFIVTSHETHARFIVETLRADKHVFVEKPLAIREDALPDIEAAVRQHPDKLVMVGFNRRFSPHTAKIRELVTGRGGPLCMNMTINAGAIPVDHWTQDPERGGGRIVGEACHFIDLLSSIAGATIRSVSAIMVGEGSAVREDKMAIALGFEDGSIGTVNYFANGSKSYPKETLQIFCDGTVLHLDNFREITGHGLKGFRRFKTRRQDKGHQVEISRFIERVSNGGQPLIPVAKLFNVTRATFAAVESARTGRTIEGV